MFFYIVFCSMEGYGQTTPSGFETVFYEGFDYPTGQDLYYQSGGNGFTSIWSGYYQNKYLSVQSSGWTYPNLQTTGLRAGYGSTCYGACNEISSSGREIPSLSTGVLYLQFLANFGTQLGGGTPHLRLYDDSDLKVVIGANSASNWQLLAIDSNITASTVSSVSVLSLVVVRFDYDSGNIKIWIDPNLATFDYANTPSPSAEINSVTTPSFNRLELYFRFNGNPGIDEILAFKLSSPPIITGPNSDTGLTNTVSINENATAVHTFSADETVTWSLGSTNDEALFGMDSSGNLVFTNAPDFEAPSSVLNSNTYVVEVIATDAANNSTTQTLTITVVDIPNTTFGTFAAINKQYFVGTYSILPPTTNNTRPIVYTSDNTAVATISGSVITFTDVGTANITATQAADANYEGNTVSTLLTVLGKDLVSKYGGISSTDVIFADANGKVGGAFGMNKYGDIQDIYEDLVTSGLIMHLDAGNTSSYPGTGSTWSDLSGYGNHGTLINGVTYTSANSGSLFFDGVDDYFVTNTNLDLSNTDKLTVQIILKTATTSEKMIMEHSINWNSNNAYGVFINNNKMQFTDHNQGYNVRNSVATINDNNWHLLSATTDRSLSATDQTRIYIDGNSANSVNVPNLVNDNSGNFTSHKLYISSRAGLNYFFNGTIAQVLIYNRVLTTEEIQQNYNATKSRYGL